MKPDKRQANILTQTLKPTEPTIWALRKPLPQQDKPLTDGTVQAGSLYEHLFGYDPIRIGNVMAGVPMPDIQKGSAENPKLNIITPNTNFLVKSLSSESQ